MIKIITIAFIMMIFTGCVNTTNRMYTYHKILSYSANQNNYNSSMNHNSYSHPTMRPYVVRGIKYYPHSVKVGKKFRGNASWYGPNFHGKLTSNGERYNMYDMTAAHKTLPMNTMLKVTNRRNGLSTVVRINDRGPFVSTRIIDLSKSAANKINMIGTGTAPVTIEVLGFYSKNKKYNSRTKYIKKPKKIKANVYGDFALQIASFSKIAGAISTQEKYDNIDGYKTIIKDVDIDNRRIFKVYLIGFKSEQEIREYKNNSIFHRAFIVREN